MNALTLEAAQSPDARMVRAACPHDCPDTCAMQVTVEQGRVVRIQGDPDHPTTHGALCTKVSRYAERTYHPERVLHPLRRVGRKGEGRFERIGWDAALEEIAARLDVPFFTMPTTPVLPRPRTTGMPHSVSALAMTSAVRCS